MFALLIRYEGYWQQKNLDFKVLKFKVSESINSVYYRFLIDLRFQFSQKK